MKLNLLKKLTGLFSDDFPDLYLVGGTVRDLQMKRECKDVDIACLNAGNIAKTFADRFNLAYVPMETKPDEPCYRIVERGCPQNFLDIAELRGRNITEDLMRRDFTVNAMGMKILPGGNTGKLIDPLNGMEDIQKKIIRKVSDTGMPSDPLRILRAFRFTAQLDFTMDPATREHCKRFSPLLAGVARERILSELIQILDVPQCSQTFRQLGDFEILDKIIPQIPSMKACKQDAFHHLNVFDHSLLVLEKCEYILNNLDTIFEEFSPLITENLSADNRRPILKLAALLHDVGKPVTRRYDAKKERITFYRHDKEGAKIVGRIGAELKMSIRDRKYLGRLVAEHRHVRDLDKNNVKRTTLMRWLRSVNEDSIPAIILSMADSEAKLGPLSNARTRQAFFRWARELVKSYYSHFRHKLDEPPLLTGHDLISLGVVPGPELGSVLKRIREAQDAGSIADKEEAVALAQELLKAGE